MLYILLYIWALYSSVKILVKMETSNLHNFTLSQFRSFFPEDPCIGLGNDIYVMDVKLQRTHQPLLHPCRFDGYMLLLCIRGHFKMTVNLTEFEIKENMVFMNVPGNIIMVNEIVGTPQEDVRYMCLAMSKEFVQGMHVDVNKLFNEGMSMLENPSITLDKDGLELIASLLEIIKNIMMSDIPYKKEMIYSQISSMFYLIMGEWALRSDLNNSTSVQSNRSKAIFDQFIKLVSEYHSQYRNVGFYADKLCLTPKYLSKLIKMATGRSAPDWIDSYVILEAKNMLKYSNVAIKEIVYRLNFPNQSVFYKFFKARTGMTPTEYRNS